MASTRRGFLLSLAALAVPTAAPSAPGIIFLGGAQPLVLPPGDRRFFVVDTFNDWRATKLFIIGDEAASRASLAAQKVRLKRLITGAVRTGRSSGVGS